MEEEETVLEELVIARLTPGAKVVTPPIWLVVRLIVFIVFVFDVTLIAADTTLVPVVVGILVVEAGVVEVVDVVEVVEGVEVVEVEEVVRMVEVVGLVEVAEVVEVVAGLLWVLPSKMLLIWAT